MVYPALLSLMPHTSAGQQSNELTPPPGRFKWTGPFRAKDEIWFLRMCHHVSNGRKNKSGFCACAITFQTQSACLQEDFEALDFKHKR
jgi:hypothetical protein